MATASFQMQGLASNGTLYSWISPAPDWIAAYAPVLHDGSAWLDVVVAGGGFDIGESVPTNTVTLTDGSRVTITDGSFVTTS